jgi:hypothetical protein
MDHLDIKVAIINAWVVETQISKFPFHQSTPTISHLPTRILPHLLVVLDHHAVEKV